MLEQKSPHSIHVFVCLNTRHDGTPSCGEVEGMEGLADALKTRCKSEGLPVRVTRSKCLGPCAKGPNIMIYPQQVLMSAVSPSDEDALVARLKEMTENLPPKPVG